MGLVTPAPRTDPRPLCGSRDTWGIHGRHPDRNPKRTPVGPDGVEITVPRNVFRPYLFVCVPPAPPASTPDVGSPRLSPPSLGIPGPRRPPLSRDGCGTSARDGCGTSARDPEVLPLLHFRTTRLGGSSPTKHDHRGPGVCVPLGESGLRVKGAGNVIRFRSPREHR